MIHDSASTPEKARSTIQWNFGKGHKDWQNLFSITRLRYIEALFHIFYHNLGKENGSLYRGLCCIRHSYCMSRFHCNKISLYRGTFPHVLLLLERGREYRSLVPSNFVVYDRAWFFESRSYSSCEQTITRDRPRATKTHLVGKYRLV